MMIAKRSPEESIASPTSGVRARMNVAEVFGEALPSILKMARNKGFDDSGQQDIAQTVGVILVEQSDNYDSERGSPLQWVIGITRNVLRDVERKRRTEQRYLEQSPSDNLVHGQPALDLTPEESARARDALALVGAALTDEEREIFELSVEQHTASEIASIFGLTRSKVEQTIRQARARLEALLKRLGQDKRVMVDIRSAAVLPFLTVEDLETALRAGRVREGATEELWQGVLSRLGHSGGGDEPPDDPKSPKAPETGKNHPPTHADSPAPAGGTPALSAPPPRLPNASHLGRVGATVTKGLTLSASTAGLSAAVIFVAGAVVGIGVDRATLGPPRLESQGASAASTTLAGEGFPTTLAPPTTNTADPLLTLALPTQSAATGQSPQTARTHPTATAPSTDPATVDESTLLQMALSAPPQRALELANKHAARFPSSKYTGKREGIVVRALVALGRTKEAEARAKALKGTVYEKPIADALGATPP